jgi:branched-chain amino acid transport system ATP-binding protein
MLQLTDVHVRYGGIAALRGVSLTAAPGEIVALLGANGAGKSTCLRTISGLVRPHAGAVELDGAPLHRVSPEEIMRRGIGHVPEHRRVFAPLSVADNLLLGGYSLGRRGRREHFRERLGFVYDLFPRLAERHGQLSGTLSGGEQQMLAIGRALMGGPRVLLMDEPSLGLAPLVVDSIFQALDRLRRGGLTVLLVEQFARSALGVADRAYVLRMGRVVLSGSSRELAEDPRLLESYLGSPTDGIESQRSAQ